MGCTCASGGWGVKWGVVGRALVEQALVEQALVGQGVVAGLLGVGVVEQAHCV